MQLACTQALSYVGIHLVTWALFLSSLIPSLPTINGGA